MKSARDFYASLPRWKVWQTRIDLGQHQDKILLLLALVISAVVGLIVVAFVAVTERLGRVLLTAGTFERAFIPLTGSLVGGWLLFRFFPEARGSGIPQTRVALILRNGVISMRTVIGKFVCSAISLGSGVALGREGPSVHIGAGLASFAGRKLGLSEDHVRSLIPVGTAAAVASAFNTPLAAVLFTLEEILADLHARVVGSVVIGAATSWIVLRLILGDEPLFHVPAYQLVHPLEFVIYALLGIAGGLVSTAFVKLLLWQRSRFLRAPSAWMPFTPAVGGAVTGLLAIAVPGVLGVGYNLVGDALNGRMAARMMVLLLVLKLVATATCYGSGNAGGIFGPSLFIGAMLGGAVGQVAHSLLPSHTGNAGAYALVGMGAAFAGIVRTPMTSVIMIFEVTRDYTIIVPLMISNLCSYVLAQRLQRLPIYEALCRQDGITMPSPSHLPEPLIVEQAMRPVDAARPEMPAGPRVHPDDPVDAALQRMARAELEQIAVVSRAGGEPVGILDVDNILPAYRLHSRQSERVSAGNWLPVVGAITVAATLIASGLVFWQRSRVSELAAAAYGDGQDLLAKGQVEEAIIEFRTALSHSPRDLRARVALGLALVRAGHFEEASSYLAEAVKHDRTDGRVWTGLARIALARQDRSKALEYFREGLSQQWPASDSAARRTDELYYADLLDQSGMKSQAVALLLSVIQQHGDDPVAATAAADKIQTIGSPPQLEEAYSTLATRFPADVSVWMRLGDARFAGHQDLAALEAYNRAVEVDSTNPSASRAAALVEEVLRLDPTRRSLAAKDRSGRQEKLVERIVSDLGACDATAGPGRVKVPAEKSRIGSDATAKKYAAALNLWQTAPEECKNDPVLVHILDKLSPLVQAPRAGGGRP